MQCDVVRIYEVHGLLHVLLPVRPLVLLYYELRCTDVTDDQWHIIVPDHGVAPLIDPVYARPLASGTHSDTEVRTGGCDVGIDPFSTFEPSGYGGDHERELQFPPEDVG